MVRSDLTEYPGVICVDFNPWRFGEADDLVQQFFGVLASKLGRADALKTTKDRVGEVLRGYGKALRSIPLLGESLSGTAEAAGEQMAAPDLDELRERFESVLREAKARIVVFIDDVDRLDASEIRALVRLVKLTAGFERITYVLAFDLDVVAAALVPVVGGGAPRDGRRYLEKIVQVPLQLPAADASTLFQLMLEYTSTAIAGAEGAFPQGDQEAFLRYVRPLFSAAPRTVREGKRYANAVGFALPIVTGEVHTGDFLLIEALRAWFPDVYARVQDNRRLFVGQYAESRPYEHAGGPGGTAAKAAWEAVIMELDATGREAVTDVLNHLFPWVQAVTKNNHFGSDWFGRWEREQRVAARHYFDRYFQYAVPATDVGDRRLSEVESMLAAADLGASVAALRAVNAQGATERLIDKLGVRTESLTATAADTLARAIAATGEDYGNEGGLFGSFLSPAASAGRVVRRCVQRLAPDARETLALDIVNGTPSLFFAAMCYRMLRAYEKEVVEGTAPLTEETWRRVGEVFGHRLESEHLREPLYRRSPINEARTLLTWWAILQGRSHVDTDLAKRLGAEPAEAAAFLLPFRSHGFVMETGLRTPDVISREDYKSVAELTDPVQLFDALVRVYGNAVGLYEEFSLLSWGSDEEAVANQFAFAHRVARAQVDAVPTNVVDSGVTADNAHAIAGEERGADGGVEDGASHANEKST